MAFTDWSGRLLTIGASAHEYASIAASYAGDPPNVQAALDTLIAGISNTDLTVMLNTWRTSGAPFHAGYPGGGLPFGAGAAILTGNPADDAYAISAGTGVKLSVSGGGGGTVASVFGRTGSVVATTGDYTAAQVGADASGAAAAAQAASLQKTANLSDVADAGTSRLNLHVPSLTPAAAVATTNQASLSGLLTIDGYTLVAGDLVLLTAQSTASQNGLWVAASGAWTRPTEMASGGVIKARTCAVINGTTNAKTQWLLQTNSTITIDTTSQTWVQISGGGSGSSTLAGDTDVSISSPSAGQGLVYNSSTGKWNNGTASAENVNAVASSGSGTVTIPDPWASPFETLSDVTLTGNPTFAFPTAAAGKSFTIILRQDGTGGRVVTWPIAAGNWLGGGVAPVLSTAAGAVDVATFVCTDGSNWIGVFSAGYAVSTGQGCTVWHNASQAVGSSSQVVMAWNQSEEDTSGFHSTSVNNSRVTIPAGLGGVYMVACTLITDTGSGSGLSVTLRKNGSTALRGIQQLASTTVNLGHPLTVRAVLAAADYIEILAEYGTGSGNILSSQTGSFLQVTKVG